MARSQNTNRLKQDAMPYALTFSGSQRVVLTNMGTLGSGLMAAFSYGIWLRTNSKLTTTQYYIGGSNATGGQYLLCGITRTSGNVGFVNFQIRDFSGHQLGVQVSTRRVNDGIWHHLVGTKDATNTVAGMKMYIDGVSQTLTSINTTALTDNEDFTRAMAIGSSLGTGAVTNGWVGSLSRPYFYKKELSPTEVSDWYFNRTVPSGEFAGYECTEGANTTVADTLGVNTGTLTAAGQWTADTPYKSRSQRVL